MLQPLQDFFSGNFMAHEYCFLWKPELVWLHAGSDLLIALTYYSIPLLLIYFVRRRQDVRFQGIFLLFSALILSCGTSHLLEVWTLWYPAYWLSGLMKAITAIVSLYTVLELVPLIPKALALPSPAQLETANLVLEKEIAEHKQTVAALSLVQDITKRKKVEDDLRTAKQELEQRLEERTRELERANEDLQTKIAALSLQQNRSKAEVDLQQSEAQLRAQATQIKQTLRQLQQTQGQLVQTEKMSSLGMMVAGIAHEINNPVCFLYANLTPAREYIQELLEVINLYRQHYPVPAPAIQEYIDAIDLDFLVEDLPQVLESMKLGSERICDIVATLRNFSRLDQGKMKPVNIHEGLDTTLQILQHRLKEKSGRPAIEVIKKYDSLPLVECYAGQLNQVFMNILANAIDALESQTVSSEEVGREQFTPVPSPRIQICTEVAEDLESTEDSKSVVIRIIDNGPGMTERVKQMLFDPFFTTKPVGQGTGLGLSISYQIVVTEHGGQLRCESAPGQGTEFIIEIPIVQPNRKPNASSNATPELQKLLSKNRQLC